MSDKRELWICLAVATAIVALQSFVLLRYEQFFDSDQAVYGLMAKHLSEFRTFPLFFYGQNYMLGVQSWLAVSSAVPREKISRFTAASRRSRRQRLSAADSVVRNERNDRQDRAAHLTQFNQQHSARRGRHRGHHPRAHAFNDGQDGTQGDPHPIVHDVHELQIHRDWTGTARAASTRMALLAEETSGTRQEHCGDGHFREVSHDEGSDALREGRAKRRDKA